VTVFNLTEGLGLLEAGIKVSEESDWNEKQAAIRQGIVWMHACYEILIEKRFLSHQTSVFDFCKSSSRTRASPRILLDIGYDDIDDLSTVKQEMPPP
jgi:hypothetical protein